MSSPVIQVSSLSKQYRLGQVGAGSLAEDINRLWHRARGKEDPYLIVGEENNRESKGNSKYIWALRDIHLDIEQGDRVGIIGSNGAGKSTLLKILSRTLSPTTGMVKIKGKVASLLEVGTGFHPDLSGRDNIFLNGAFLGMSKRDIKSRFDEIIEFAGVARYIDTPVKRYSSGMYVRLAFAVAAHLESDILIVDEVLAVGDAEFQKKCLGKMGEVSEKEGKTILFVSHNMTTMNSLCDRIIYLKNGYIHRVGDTQTIINDYVKTSLNSITHKKWEISDAPGDGIVKLMEVKLTDENQNVINSIEFNTGAFIEYSYHILQSGYHPVPNLHLFDKYNEHVFVTTANHSDSYSQPGFYTSKVKLPPHFLNDGQYIAGVAISTLLPHVVHFFEKDALHFEVIENMECRHTNYRGKMPGTIRPLLVWENKRIN
jgi:lipopolysaccharide transport system ATP-binding protein